MRYRINYDSDRHYQNHNITLIRLIETSQNRSVSSKFTSCIWKLRFIRIFIHVVQTSLLSFPFVPLYRYYISRIFFAFLFFFTRQTMTSRYLSTGNRRPTRTLRTSFGTFSSARVLDADKLENIIPPLYRCAFIMSRFSSVNQRTRRSVMNTRYIHRATYCWLRLIPRNSRRAASSYAAYSLVPAARWFNDVVSFRLFVREIATRDSLTVKNMKKSRVSESFATTISRNT